MKPIISNIYEFTSIECHAILSPMSNLVCKNKHKISFPKTFYWPLYNVYLGLSSIRSEAGERTSPKNVLVFLITTSLWVVLNRVPTHSHPLPTTHTHYHPLPPPPTYFHWPPSTSIHSHPLPSTPTHSYPLPPLLNHSHLLPSTPTFYHVLAITVIYSHSLLIDSYPLWPAPIHIHPLPFTPSIPTYPNQFSQTRMYIPCSSNLLPILQIQTFLISNKISGSLCSPIRWRITYCILN